LRTFAAALKQLLLRDAHNIVVTVDEIMSPNGCAGRRPGRALQSPSQSRTHFERGAGHTVRDQHDRPSQAGCGSE
jgi:hypothetical protein